MSHLEQRSGPSTSKKIRMTMACERCRSKKVKCDFTHPSCSRCQQAKATCSYNGSSTQVDLFNLVKLNETVDMLQRRVQSIESDMKNVSANTSYIAEEFRTTRTAEANNTVVTTVKNMATSLSSSSSSSNTSTSDAQWTLSLTPNGLRIDTNVISTNGLYDILLAGLSHQELVDSRSSGCSHQSDVSSQSSLSSKASSLDAASATIARKKELWKTRLKTFPVYSTWEPQNEQENELHGTVSKEKHDALMDIYSQCMLALPCADPNSSVIGRYRNGTLDPLLMNSVFAWAARHAAVHHDDLFPGQNPNKIGEPFFTEAKELLKERFTSTDVDTMHSLLLMYIYAVGRPSSESEAYIYLGLAVRMCLDLKMYQEPTDVNPLVCERNRRFFWALYFLETLCTIHSDKTFSLPPEEMITVSYPSVMEHEKDEVRWRVEFITQRFRITRIYRDIIHTTTQDNLLLSSISVLDKRLQDWYDQLIPEFKYTPGQDNIKRNWGSLSYREQACIKLNAEYNFQICQLYSLFASRTVADIPQQQQQQQPSAIDLLAKKRCLLAADTIVELLECFAQLNQGWCHFSLERPMVPAMLYNFLLSRNEGDCTRHKRQLQRIADVLRSSPVRQHKMVVTFVERVEKLVREQKVENLDLKDVTDKQREQPAVAAPAPPPAAGTSKPVPILSDTPDVSSSSPYFQHIMKEQHHQLQQPMIETPIELNDFLCAPPSIGLCYTDGSTTDDMMALPQVAAAAATATYGSLDSGFVLDYYNPAHFGRWTTPNSVPFAAPNNYASPVSYTNDNVSITLQPPHLPHNSNDMKGPYHYFGGHAHT